MTDTNSDRKWFYRGALILLGMASAYLVLQPPYNFAHWVPHQWLRSISVPYPLVLAAESHADKFLHLLLGFILTILLHGARLPMLGGSIFKAMLVLCSGMIMAEVAQFFIGRDFDQLDILLGVAGSCLAALYQRRIDLG